MYGELYEGGLNSDSKPMLKNYAAKYRYEQDSLSELGVYDLN